jgi:hypothetical protein
MSQYQVEEVRTTTLALRRSPTAAPPCSLRGLRPPGPPPCATRPRRVVPLGARAGAPGALAYRLRPPSRPAVPCSRHSPVCAEHLRYVAPCGPGRSSLRLSGPLFAHFACCRAGAPAPALARCGAGAPPPAVAAPVRLLEPVPTVLRGRAPAGAPGFFARPVCALRAPWRSLPPQSLPSPSSPVRPSFGRPSSVPARVGSLRGPPVPPPAVRYAASGPVGSGPGALAGLRPAFFRPRPRAFLCSGAAPPALSLAR